MATPLGLAEFDLSQGRTLLDLEWQPRTPAGSEGAIEHGTQGLHAKPSSEKPTARQSPPSIDLIDVDLGSGVYSREPAQAAESATFARNGGPQWSRVDTLWVEAGAAVRCVAARDAAFKWIREFLGYPTDEPLEPSRVCLVAALRDTNLSGSIAKAEALAGDAPMRIVFRDSGCSTSLDDSRVLAELLDSGFDIEVPEPVWTQGVQADEVLQYAANRGQFSPRLAGLGSVLDRPQLADLVSNLSIGQLQQLAPMRALLAAVTSRLLFGVRQRRFVVRPSSSELSGFIVEALPIASIWADREVEQPIPGSLAVASPPRFP